LLRSSGAWLELERVAGEALVPLGALCEVRRGITSGANDVFYLPRARARALGLEPEVLLPLVRSPRAAAATIAIDPGATRDVALVCPPDEQALSRYPAAGRYLADRAEARLRPTLRSRRSWWALPARPARLFFTKAYAARFLHRLAPVPVVADQRVYSLHPRPGIRLELVAAALNSTFGAFAIESLGRASMGEGALEWAVDDARGLPVLDPRALASRDAAAVRSALAAVAARPIGPVDAERGRPDRRRLDAAVAAPWPALASLLEPVHDALIGSVRRRAARGQAGRLARRAPASS
jgi:hypothetical protein